MPDKFRISVRSLVEFFMRSGDIRPGKGSLAEKNAMQEGSRIHRKLQKGRGITYHSEVALSYTLEKPEYELCIEGRADGIDIREDGIEIEEIKGIYADLMEMEQPVPVHLAQAKSYAAMFCLNKGAIKEKQPGKLPEEISVAVTYCNLESEEIRQFRTSYRREEITAWFLELLSGYEKWMMLRVAHLQRRNQSISNLTFPFSYREGQKNMVALIYRALREDRQLFLHAPTGIGKTMSAVFPAVHALANEGYEKMFYLTAKTISRTVAEEAIAILRARSLQLRSVTITAKEKICPCETVQCDPELCARAKGHYDRINDALYAFLCGQMNGTREEIERFSKLHCICPYEFQIDLAEFADGIICDYNYAFDPTTQIGTYFKEGTKKQNVLLLIDEAHNLVERARAMYSASLMQTDLDQIYRHMKNRDQKLKSALGKACREMKRARSESADCFEKRFLQKEADAGALFVQARSSNVVCRKHVRLGNLVIVLLRLDSILAERLSDADFLKEDAEQRSSVLEFYFRLHFFLMIFERADEHYSVYDEIDLNDEKRYTVHLSCMDPSAILQNVLSLVRSSIFFSATLLPIQYYLQMLTKETDCDRVYIPSPFPEKNRLLLIGRDISTRYRERTPAMYRKIASYIQKITEIRKGNYIVFFPSYHLLETVLEAFSAESPKAETGERVLLIQHPDMDEAMRETFLKSFEENTDDRTLIAFCVMGGIFSEGIDLAGERLIGSIIVGTGLPQIGTQRELLRDYFDERRKNGFDFAYRFPAMNKVLQAAGRLIRTDTDQGVIALLDDRFLLPENRRLFPREWDDFKMTTLEQVSGEVERFWKEATGMCN